MPPIKLPATLSLLGFSLPEPFIEMGREPPHGMFDCDMPPVNESRPDMVKLEPYPLFCDAPMLVPL
jgi:hypothetical protein